jgi:hypothetical protein
MGSLFSSPQQQYTTPPLPSYVQDYLKAASTYLTGQVGAPGPAYPGPFVADITPQQGQAITDITTQEQAAQPLAGTGAGTIQDFASGAYLPGGAKGNPYLSGIVGTITDVTNQQMQRYLSDVRQRYSAMNLGTSSGLLDEESRVLGAVLPAEAQQIGSVLSSAYTTGTGQELAAAGTAATLPTDLSSTLLSAGAVPQQTQQALYNAWLNEFNRLQNQRTGAAGQGAGLASLQAPQPATYGPPPILGLATGAASLYRGKNPTSALGLAA